jgi:predicted CoA-binding protein
LPPGNTPVAAPAREALTAGSGSGAALTALPPCRPRSPGLPLPAMDPTRARAILASSPTVAVLGIHTAPDKPAHYVPAYLHEQGYHILGVNPGLAGQQLFGEPVRAALTEITEPIDLVDVFRRPDALPAHVDEIIAARPRAVWFQLGIRNDGVAQQLEAAGIEVVQDRCTLADHRRWGLGRPVRP